MRTQTLLVAALTLGFAPAPPPRPNSKADLHKLQGSWSVTTEEGGGWTGFLFSPGGQTFITQASYSHKSGDGAFCSACSITVDARARPKRLDFGKGYVRAIYRLEGNALLVSY